MKRRKQDKYLKVVELRKQGYSLKEIAKSVRVSYSTLSLWCKDVVLLESAKLRILNRSIEGRRKARETTQLKIIQRDLNIQNEIIKELSSLNLDGKLALILVSMLYWGEGAKTTGVVAFTNSDPVMVSLFMKLLKKSFDIDPAKFRATVHLHEYHDKVQQTKYWSKVTGIPKINVYQKPNTGKSKKLGYPGCIRVMYYDVKVFRKLIMTYEVFSAKILNVDMGAW